MWYKLNINKLAVLLLPTFLRKAKLVALLKVLCSPINTLYSAWLAMRTTHLYRLQHNGQTCYLRKVLNDGADPIQRRIQLSDGNRYQRHYIFTAAEQQNHYLGTTHLRKTTDYADTGVDFRVIVPNDISNWTYLQSLCNYYKPAGKRFKIEYNE